jgi:hypothetical protein
MFVKEAIETIQHWAIHEQWVDLTGKRQETGRTKITSVSLTNQNSEGDFKQWGRERSVTLGKITQPNNRDEHGGETVSVVEKRDIKDCGESCWYEVGTVWEDPEGSLFPRNRAYCN